MSTISKPPVYVIALGGFALGMDAYATAGLIPMIGAAFAVPVAVAAQLVTAFTLAYGLGSPVCVALLPARHQRASLLLALALFTLANVASALAPDIVALLIFRAVAGVGAGVYLATGIAASTALAPPERRGKSIAVIMGGMASGTVLGVPLSLLLAQRFGWASALWLVAAIGAAALIGLLLRLPALPVTPAVPLRAKLKLLGDGQVLGVLLVSLLAAVSSLGMYTYFAPFLAEANPGASVVPYLWAWGVGGVLGSFLIGPIADRVRAAVLTLWIMAVLAIALLLLPIIATFGAYLTMLPIAVWGAVGWALQIPQNSELIRVRERQGGGNLAVALNGSTLYLGSAIGAALGGLLLLERTPAATLAWAAGAVAALGAGLQIANLRRRPALTPCAEVQR
ncbi:MAG: MFS transporter [Pelomonas sp.]|nr:MFS transporter [Roseateles sp.]